MIIRKFLKTDISGIVKICLSDATNGNTAWSEGILTCFCRYYLNEEPQNCFVAISEDDEVLGYILCAENYRIWERTFLEKYILPCKNPIAVQMAQGTINCLRPFSQDYPAHLHIDVSPKAQGTGIGTALLSALKKHLRDKKISGLALDVASDNDGAIRFYKRNGFEILSSSSLECVMGCIL